MEKLSINSVYYYVNGTKIMKNYLLFVGLKDGILLSYLDFDKHSSELLIRLDGYILDGSLFVMLGDSVNDKYFVDPLVREIMFESYAYEINKYLKKEIINDGFCNKRILSLFEKLYNIDFVAELENINVDLFSQENIDRYSFYRWNTFVDIDSIKDKYFSFVFSILTNYGYLSEVEALEKFLKSPNFILITDDLSSKTGISLCTDKSCMVSVSGNMLGTLFHELTHVVNNFFRKIYNKQDGPQYQYTLFNEGVANFVEFNLQDYILGKTEDGLWSENIYLPIYSYLYANLYFKGNGFAENNKQILLESLKKFGQNYIDKLDFFYDRFFKFFPFEQNIYLYPKELLYGIGYQKVLNKFATCDDKHKLLADLFVTKAVI